MVIATPKTVFNALVLNPYRASGKFYDPKRLHTGIDLAYNYEPLSSPVTGRIKRVAVQKEMGNVCYIEDVWEAIHVFAHMGRILATEGDRVNRGQLIGITANSGTATTGPHLHYEVITKELRNTKEDYPVKRKLWAFSGYNTAPIKYLEDLYLFHNIDSKTGKKRGIPTWLNTIKNKISKIPEWLRT